ncbi:MAG: hypothetical protein EBT36_14210 [Betaproteobacteria bacterium]|nr:hypothetical protein [Betaproteobacteria bacterium]NBT72481.1 hypothetical protein [Betaproteobacteria bacterium]
MLLSTGQLPEGSAKRFARQRQTESRLRLDAARDLEHNIATGRLKMPSLAPMMILRHANMKRR